MSVTALSSSSSFITSMVSSFSMIMVSEIGDKTFLIAAIMSMTHGRGRVFAGAIAALAVMTILSTAFGVFFPQFFSKSLTNWITAILFAVFGFKMIRDGQQMSENQLEEEYAQVAQELESGGQTMKSDGLEATVSVASGSRFNLDGLFWKVFSLTFLAEWGDRSQIATIALAAAQDPVGVTFGAIIGHSVCTLLAVFFGGLLAKWVSIRTVTMAGGSMFVLFSVLTILGIM